MNLVVNDKATRDAIEKYTDENTFPDIIRFIEDKDGDWVTSQECLTDPEYTKELSIMTELTKAISKTPSPKEATTDTKITTEPIK